MMDGDDDTTIGTGGWILVVLSGIVTFAVLRAWMFYHPVPAALFAAAIALIVLLLLYRLAQAVNRYEDEEEARKIRKIVPGSADPGVRIGEGGAAPLAVAVPVRAETPVAPQRVSGVVTPLAGVGTPPVILPQVVAAPVEEAEATVARMAEGPVDKPKAKAAAKPKADAKPKAAKAKAEPKPKAASKPKAEGAAKAKAAKAKPVALVRLEAPRGGTADDLQEIEGIGPALEKLMNSLGFYHFDQIASWTEADVALVDTDMKTFKGRITRDKWVEQARIIVNDGLEAFRERAKTNSY
jgi:predicted flap endonuclease-1-like 5' DNA nuclease